MHRALISLGSNLGDARLHVLRAIELLEAFGSVTARSSLYRTVPWGKTDQPDFINAAVALQTDLDARELLAALQRVEHRLHRVRQERWGPRTIDLDLLVFDDERIDEPHLVVPHPRITERAFVLVPLAEIDARYVAARDALDRSERAGVVRIAGSAAHNTHD
jgi:2-amino-4-hydroxy-6-hydroxymethyldihydropteridine diphosphokinase